MLHILSNMFFFSYIIINRLNGLKQNEENFSIGNMLSI